MSTAGPNSPAAGADDTSTGSGTTAWTNPGNITAQDSTYATANGAQTTHWLKGTNYGFAIPGGSTINGVTLSIIEGGYSQSAGSSSSWYAFLWNSVQIGSGISSSFGASLGATTLTMGGASNLWGATLDTTITNASTFGVEMRIDANAGSTITASNIDCLQLTITYTLAATGYKNLPLMGVGLINTLIHGLTLGLCSWRWRPFTRTQTRTAGVMA